MVILLIPGRGVICECGTLECGGSYLFSYYISKSATSKTSEHSLSSIVSTLQNLDLQLEFFGIGNGTQPGTQIWIKLFLILKKSKISELQLT